MFLNALDSGLIILDLAVEFLSVENLPTVVNVACCTNLLNDFSYEGRTTVVSGGMLLTKCPVGLRNLLTSHLNAMGRL